MKNRFKRFKTWLVPKNDDRVYVSLNNQKFLYKEVIDGVIVAKSGADLKILLEKVRSIHWTEPTRHMFLLGLLQNIY